MELSILIPARNEQFLAQTIKNILANIRGETEIIAVCDGNWPEPPIEDHPRTTLVYHPHSIGQRAATNEAAKLSEARFIMKADAHCAFDEGFDVKLMADCECDWTVVPRMYNLHAFDWQCDKCGNRTYQGPYPDSCEKCDNTSSFKQIVVWEPRWNRETDFARFDRDLHFQYWGAYKHRPAAQGDIADLMCCVGACWFMHRARYWELGGLDEKHGSWGQMGVEIACKSWLSGGRQVVNKKTWFAHLFRTQKGFGFPYPNPGNQVQKAREYSKQLWLGDNWAGAIKPFGYILEKFAPVPEWNVDKGIIYYTDNRLDEEIANTCRRQIEHAAPEDVKIVSASLKPVKFGHNICLDLERGILTMFRQILTALQVIRADVVFFCEHDVLYHPSHFDFMPDREDQYYYNENVWKVRTSDGQALFYYCQQTSGLCAYRDLLIDHYEKRIEIVEREGFTRRMGFEPGKPTRHGGVDNYKRKSWMSEFPNIDIRHEHNLTPSRFRKDQFRNQRYTRGWTLADEVPGWGITKDRFFEFLQEVKPL